MITSRQLLLLSQKKWRNQYSYLFDGVNERINIDAVQTALATTTTGTWSCWVKPVDATPAQHNEIITFANGNTTDLIQLFIVATTGVLRSTGNNDNIIQWDVDTDNTPFTDNTWGHVALVQDGISPVLYVNGVAPAQTFNVSTDKTVWFNNLVLNNGRIGCRFFTASDGELPFNGNIDEVGFFNTNLSAAQITEIYNNGKPKNLLKHSMSGNLVSYFRMGDKDSFDGTNWTLVDQKGTNNGSSVNMEESDRSLDTA